MWQMLATMRADLDAAIDRDPAARSRAEVALLYPGVHAIWSHRLANSMWHAGARLPARALSQFSRFLTNIEIHPAATIGCRLFIDHGAGVVIGATAEVGDDVTLYHGVTLGGTSLAPVKRHPTLGDRVMVGAGAKLLGPVTVGADSKIGANAVVLKDVPAGSVVVGVPGQVISARQAVADCALVEETDVQPATPATATTAAFRAPQISDALGSDAAMPADIQGLDRTQTAADPLNFALRSLQRRVAALEQASAIAEIEPETLRADGTWEYHDYVI